MNRRSLLKGLGASAFALGTGASGLARPPVPKRVIVIGAGIIGAGVAYELAKRGAQVTVLEKKAPASGTSGDSYAYLNASTKSGSRPYFELNWLGMAGWRMWQSEPGQPLPLLWGGAVYWRDAIDESSKLEAALATVRSWGYAGEHIDGNDVGRLLPSVNRGTVNTGAYFPEEGSVDPVAAVNALLTRAAQLGARLLYPIDVTSLLVTNGVVRGVRTSQGEVLADTVVLAAGLGSRRLAEAQGIKLPLIASTGILLHTQPHKRILDRLAFSPRATFRQMTDGRMLASIGHEGASVAANTSPAQIAQDVLEATAPYLPQIRTIGIDRISVGQRVLPSDTFPIAGHAPGVDGLYMVSTHSGMTLSPILGRVAATEILDNVEVDLLEHFRPQRFA